MFPTFHEACISYILIAWMVGISVWCLYDKALFFILCFFPHDFFRKQQRYTLLTSPFIHISWRHLTINIFCLLTFLSEDEYMIKDDFGPFNGSILMIVMISSFAFIPVWAEGYLKRHDPNYLSAGASAMVFAGLMFYFFYLPMEELQFSFSVLHISYYYELGFLCFVVLTLLWLFRIGPAARTHWFGALTGLAMATLVSIF
ncbi:Rhomboid family protein [bacterium A37T11]|nr:Rhomboid family protein [bacterium A37T11]